MHPLAPPKLLGAFLPGPLDETLGRSHYLKSFLGHEKSSSHFNLQNNLIQYENDQSCVIGTYSKLYLKLNFLASYFWFEGFREVGAEGRKAVVTFSLTLHFPAAASDTF